MKDWLKDFEILFGDVDNKDSIRVFIEDLLEAERKKTLEEVVELIKKEKEGIRESDVYTRHERDMAIEGVINLECSLHGKFGKLIPKTI